MSKGTKVKKNATSDHHANLNVRIPLEMMKGLEVLAQSVGESVSTVVRVALHEKLQASGLVTAKFPLVISKT